MKIKNLTIENFKSITTLSLRNLGDFIIIAGPNGTGKSTIMEAVKLLKSCYGGYQQNELQNLCNSIGGRLQPHMGISNFLNDPSKVLKIEIDLELNHEEKKFCKNNLDKLKVNYGLVKKAGNVTDLNLSSVSNDEKKNCEKELNSPYVKGVVISKNGLLTIINNPLLSWICSYYSPDSLGIFDFNDAFRSYNRHDLNNIPLDTKNIADNIRNSAIVNTGNKYNNIKNILAGSLVKSILSSENDNPIEQALVKLFELFFPNKKYIGPKIDRGNVRFLVKADEKEHDIDFLSSGEKEIVMGYLWLLSMNFAYSIFFIDEPELHLNPKLVKKLPLFYKDFIGKKLNSQIWLISHSDALISSALMDNEYSIYHLKHPNTESKNQIEKLDCDSAPLLFELVGEIAQYYPENKTVFLEGKNSEFDKDFIETLFPEYTNRINFFSVGDRNNVEHISEILDTLNQNASYPSKFFGICDKDFAANPKNHGNCYYWDVYHIENYLLDLEILESVLHAFALDGEKSPSKEKIEAIIREISDELVPQKVLELAQKRLSDAIKDKIKLQSNPRSKNPQYDLSANFQKTKEAIMSLDSDMAKQYWNDVEASYNNITGEEILKKVPGRDILHRIAGRLKPQISYEALRQNLIAAMRMKDKKPAGIKDVLEKILNSKSKTGV